MQTLRRAIVSGSLVPAFGDLAVPAASAAEVAPIAPGSLTAPVETFHVTRQCDIVRISENSSIRKERADGVGNNIKNAEKDADRNVPVPPGHYKRHCQTKRIW